MGGTQVSSFLKISLTECNVDSLFFTDRPIKFLKKDIFQN